MSLTFFISTLPPPFFTGTGPDFPDHDLVSLDDEQVKAILVKIGIGLSLLQEGPMPDVGAPPAGRADIRSYAYKGHPTHWLHFIRFEHAPNPADNGFVLHGYLKRTHSTEAFAKKVGEVFEHCTRPDSGGITIEPGPEDEGVIN